MKQMSNSTFGCNKAHSIAIGIETGCSGFFEVKRKVYLLCLYGIEHSLCSVNQNLHSYIATLCDVFFIMIPAFVYAVFANKHCMLFCDFTFCQPCPWSSCIKVFMSTFVEYLVWEVRMLVENVRQEGLKLCQYYIMLPFFRCRNRPVEVICA